MKGAVNALSKQLDESHKEIDHLREEVRRAREDASIDGLTGLTNRKAFDMALANCLRDMDKTNEVSLLMMDIDFFKRVNDSYGHLFGDKVIRAVAEILKQNTKGKDIVARYGGEEFVVLLPNTSLNGARVVAEQIGAMVQKVRILRSEKNEIIENISVSLGVAHYRAGESSSDFIARADKALYTSKENGRNRVTLAMAS